MSRPLSFEDLACCAVFGGLSVCLSGWLAPDIEMTVSEARLAEASIRVSQLQHIYLKSLDPVEQARLDEVPDADPWGTPYRVIVRGEHDVLAVSAGSDGVFQSLASDSDDIHTDLEESPGAESIRRNRWRLVGAFAAAIGAWLVMCRLYLRTRPLREE